MVRAGADVRCSAHVCRWPITSISQFSPRPLLVEPDMADLRLRLLDLDAEREVVSTSASYTFTMRRWAIAPCRVGLPSAATISADQGFDRDRAVSYEMRLRRGPPRWAVSAGEPAPASATLLGRKKQFFDLDQQDRRRARLLLGPLEGNHARDFRGSTVPSISQTSHLVF